MVFTCLKHRVIDISRRPRPYTVRNLEAICGGGEEAPDEIDDMEAPEKTEEAAGEIADVEGSEMTIELAPWQGKLLRERICVLQEAKTWLGECRAPYYQSLLLSERITLANQATDAGNDGMACAAFAEQWAPWVVADGELAFGADMPTLDEAWMRLRTRVEEGKSVQSTDVAAVLGIAANRYDQWVSRARHKVVEAVLGEDWEMAGELFSHWQARYGVP